MPKKEKDDVAGVVAATQRVLDCIGFGATHVIVADIEGFFTKVKKSESVSLVRKVVDDPRFIRLLANAISVDLDNARQLWRHKDQFPYGDIGVAQGNCLSPFLGNLLLSDFDEQMNTGDCGCIRYIDDIAILAPSGRAASARFRKAERMLASYGMRFAEEKTSRVPMQVVDYFEYLGIEYHNGLLRPARKSRLSIVARAKDVAARSLRAIRPSNDALTFDRDLSVPRTLGRIAGMAKGWAHHYAFCNDAQTIRDVDNLMCGIYVDYLEKANKLVVKKKAGVVATIMGYRGAAEVLFRPLAWPLHSS